MAPRPSVEQSLVGILAKLLGIDQVDVNVNENFLLLGGDSLLGIQVIAWVRDTFAVELPLHTLFECPTVKELSAEIDSRLLEKVRPMSANEAESTARGNAETNAGDL